MNQCSKTLQNRVRERKDFASNIKNNPIELLKAIVQHCISFQVNKYEMSIIMEAMKAVLNIRQRDEESLVDYTARFKSAKDVFSAQIGEPFELKEYMSENQITDKKRPYRALMAHIYLENAEKAKYGSLISNLHSQFSLRNNQFPQSLVETSNVLSNKTTTAPRMKSETQQEQTPALSFAQLEGNCYCCGKSEHKSPV